MPVEGLPKVLETTLDSLLKNNLLSSWIMRGGDEFIQLSIRFSNTAIAADMGEVKYRRASQSRLARDRLRAGYMHQSCSNDQTENGSNVSTTQTQDNVNFDNKTSNKEVQLGGSTVAHDQQVAKEDNPFTSSRAKPASGQACGGSIASGGVDTVFPQSNSYGDGVKNTSSEICDTGSDSDDDGDGLCPCDGCGVTISGDKGSIWARCTACDDADFCYECFEKDIHSQHKT